MVINLASQDAASIARRKRIKASLLALLVVLFGVHVWYSVRLNLIPDEAYYWSWSKDLDVCYRDQPGMVAWVNALFTSIIGQNELGVRAPALLFAVLSTLLVYLTVKRLFGDDVMALAAATLMNLLPVFTAGGVLFLHDNVMMFFWALALYALVCIATTGKPWYWALLALSVLAAMYSKFTAVLIVPCIGLFILLSPDQRHWIKRREPYLAAMAVLLLYMPVIAWNANHRWIAYLAVDRLSHIAAFSMAERAWSLSDFFLGQAGIVSPVIFAIIVFAMLERTYSLLRKRSDVHLLLVCTSLPLFLYFMQLSLRTKVQANWPMAVYLSGTILAVEFVWDRIKSGDVGWKVMAWVGVIACFAFSLAIHVHAIKPIVPYLAGRDITDQLYGWRELAAKVDEEKAAIGGPGIRIIARKYQIASELYFYMKGQPRPLCANYSGRGNQFDIWNDFPEFEGGSAILVDDSDLSSRFKTHFAGVKEIEPFRVIRDGRVIKEFRMWRCMGFHMKGPFEEYLKNPLAWGENKLLSARQERDQ